MKVICLIYVVANLLSICFCQMTTDKSLSFVSTECNSKLRHIDSIEKFENFIEHYKLVVESLEKPKKGLLNKDVRLRTCYNLREPLLELENLIRLRSNRVCQMDYIESLLGFHYKYLDKSKRQADDVSNQKTIKSGSSYVAYFFSLYAHQVAYNCKSKLISRVRESQTKQDCSSVLVPFLSSVLTPSLSDSDDSDKRHLMSEASSFLQQFKRVESFVPVVKFKNTSGPEAIIDVNVPSAAISKIENMKKQCLIRKPHYSAIFAPIGALAQIGIIVDEATGDSDDMNDANTRLFKCWLATAQLCQGILNTHMNVKDQCSLKPSLDSKFVSVNWATSSNESDYDPSDEIKFYDTVDEISSEIVEIVKKKFTNLSKIKVKAFEWTKSFIERHIDTEAMQKQASEQLVNILTDSESAIDSRVAMAGRRFNDKKFNIVSAALGETDTIVKSSSSLAGQKTGMILSSVVAIALSAVFVWFSLYVLVRAVEQQCSGGKVDGNFKAEWHNLKEKRKQKLDAKLIKKKSSGVLNSYKPV